MDNFNLKPDAYVRFSWEGQPMEGEFFRAYKDSDGGVIRPFDRALRQELVDDKLKHREVSFKSFINLNELITCDGIATDKSVKVGDGILNVVDQYDLIDKDDLTSNVIEIADCRHELLNRQIYVGSKIGASRRTFANRDEVDALRSELDKYTSDHFKPLRYELTRKQKVWLYITTNLAQVLLSLLFFGGLLLFS
ncbi:TPA: hypothetical protein ACN30M_004243 [Vibrio parahaemolyticus]